jgi:hypothetical protein
VLDVVALLPFSGNDDDVGVYWIVSAIAENDPTGTSMNAKAKAQRTRNIFPLKRTCPFMISTLSQTFFAVLYDNNACNHTHVGFPLIW